MMLPMPPTKLTVPRGLTVPAGLRRTINPGAALLTAAVQLLLLSQLLQLLQLLPLLLLLLLLLLSQLLLLPQLLLLSLLLLPGPVHSVLPMCLTPTTATTAVQQPSDSTSLPSLPGMLLIAQPSLPSLLISPPYHPSLLQSLRQGTCRCRSASLACPPFPDRTSLRSPAWQELSPAE